MKQIKILAVIVTVFITGVLNAQTTIEKIKERGTIRIGTSGKQLPYTYKEERGTYVGLDIELGRRLAKDLGVEAVFVQVELAKLVDTLKAGAIDAVMSGFSITNERNMEVLFTEAYFETGKAILSTDSKLLSGKKDKINRAGVKLLAIKNSSSVEMIKSHYPNVTIVEGNDAKDCKEILLSGKADAYVGDIEICEYYDYEADFKKYSYTVIKDRDSADHEFIAVAVAPEDMLFYNFVNNFVKKQIDKNSGGWILEAWEEYYDYQ